MTIGKYVLIGVASSVMAGASMVSCAAPSAYNPDNLGSTSLTRVEGVCQNVLGLSPTERPTGGNWLGNDRLDYWTSHYRGCVLSLSDSLGGADHVRMVQRAEEACKAKGLPAGSSELALCVLQGSNSRPVATQVQTAAAVKASVSEPAAQSYYRASPSETKRREQKACAAIGLSPANPEFDRCVK